jgi:hypothetical protein
MSVLEAPIILKLAPELAGILLSPEEFDAVEEYDELYNYELVHGVLVVAPPPAVGEREPNDQLGYWLRSYKDHHPQGTALDLTLPEHLIRTLDSRRRADRVIWAGLGHTPNTRQDQPTIAIEFVSASKRRCAGILDHRPLSATYDRGTGRGEPGDRDGHYRAGNVYDAPAARV